MNWFLSADLVLIILCFTAGILGSVLHTWVLHRRIYSLECATTDLENKLLVEIKRRAGQERQRAHSIDAEILEAAKKKTPEPQVPWWSRFTEPS